MDKLTSMAAFVKAVERGSFTAAARELRLSPGMVGKHIRALEDLLGVPLLVRTTRQQRLTPTGEKYAERCRMLLDEIAETERLAGEPNEQPQGLLRVNAPTTFGVHALAPALRDFFAFAPQVRVELTLNDRVVDLIDEGFDVALRIGKLAPSSLRSRRLGDYVMVVAASPAYLEKRGTPRVPTDLAAHDTLGFLASSAAPWHFVDRAGARQSIAITPAFATNSGAALREATLLGLGIVNQPRLLLETDLREHRVIELFRNFRIPAMPVHAVYPASRHVVPKLRAFLDFVAARFRATRAS